MRYRLLRVVRWTLEARRSIRTCGLCLWMGRRRKSPASDYSSTRARGGVADDREVLGEFVGACPWRESPIAGGRDFALGSLLGHPVQSSDGTVAFDNVAIVVVDVVCDLGLQSPRPQIRESPRRPSRAWLRFPTERPLTAATGSIPASINETSRQRASHE
jgi:hypothetical protein